MPSSIGLELVVISICVGSPNCQDAAKAYYAQSLELQKSAAIVQKLAEEDVGRENLALFATAGGLIFVRQGSIVIDRHVNIDVGDKTMITLHWGY